MYFTKMKTGMFQFKPVQRFEKGIFPLIRPNSHQSHQRVAKMRKDRASIYSFQSPQVTCRCEVITPSQKENDNERNGRQDDGRTTAPMQSRTTCTASRKISGNNSSIMSISRENRFKIRPTGLVSKNKTGAFNIADNIEL